MRLGSLLLASFALHAGCTTAPPPDRSDYGEELRRIDERFGAARASAVATGSEADHGQAAYLLYGRASLTEDFRHFSEAEQQISTALRAYPDSVALRLLYVDFNIKLHRLEPALAELRRLWAAAPSIDLLERLADVSLQYGDYDEAGRLYEKLVSIEPSWENLARLAYFKAHTEDRDGAEALYDRAQQLLSARQMRAYAWVELQKGILDLEDGDPARALAHFETADRVYTGYWLIKEHIAEALNLLGRRREALTVYRGVVATAPRPYVLAALAHAIRDIDPVQYAQRVDEAQRAFAADFGLYPEAAVGHYVEQLLDTRENDALVVQLATLNHAARPNADSKALLARAYLANGDRANAEALIREVAATRWRTKSTRSLDDVG